MALLAVNAMLFSVAWWGVVISRRLLRESLAAERRAQDAVAAERARTAEHMRISSAFLEHAQAFERYEFGTALRASAILRERERAS